MIGCLILHGYTGSPYELEPLANYLQEHTNWLIEVPTLPGHGETLTLEDMSHKKWIGAAEDALKQLMEKCDEVYLIGFSMGGMIASYLAAKHAIAKLVLLAPAGKYLSFRQIFRDFRDVLADGLKGNLKENELYLHYRGKLGQVPIQANIEFLKLVRFTRKFLNKIKAPVLIAQGQQDSMVPYRTAYYLDKEITSEQKDIVFFEKSRHLICHGEDKEVLNRMVLAFLAES